MYNYAPKRDDEHHLIVDCIVTNVNKQDGGWWRGDYNGKKQHWFPANHVLVSSNSTVKLFQTKIYFEFCLLQTKIFKTFFLSFQELSYDEDADDEQESESMPLGSMQKGSFDIMGRFKYDFGLSSF